MKWSRVLLFLLLLIMLLVIASSELYVFIFPPDEGFTQVFPAMVNRDCAPWDGSAFTVSIPYEAGSIIHISIWQSPEIKLPAKFSFPDETMRIGNATYLLRFSYSMQLTGTVFFWRVDRESPVEGEFDFHTEAGQQLKGKFIAEWENEIIYCGRFAFE